jgi:hypothetical protein
MNELEFGGTMYRFAIPIVSLAFLMMLAEQFLSMRQGSKADWGKPFIRTTGFILLLILYQPFSQGVIAAVKMFGSIDNVASEIATGNDAGSREGVLASRAKEFAKLRDRLNNEAYMNRANEGAANSGFLPSKEDLSSWVEKSILSLVDTALYAITWFTFTFAAFAIFALKMLSTVMTKILLEVGPAMIAFAAIPGLTSRYLSAWVMALIEVTTWGVVAKIILGLLIKVSAKSAGVAVLEDADYAEHIILNFVYAGMFLAVPYITHTILSGSASAVGSTGMAAAVGTMAGAARGAKSAAGAAAGGARGAVRGDGEGSSGGAGGDRGGDAGGNTSSGSGDSSSANSQQNARDFHAKRGAIEKQRRGD